MVSVLGSGAYTPLYYFFLALAIAAFGVETWAFVDAIVRPKAAFAAAAAMGDNAVQRLAKQWWLLILGVAFVLGLVAALTAGATGFLSILAFSRTPGLSTWLELSGLRSVSTARAAAAPRARTAAGNGRSKVQDRPERSMLRHSAHRYGATRSSSGVATRSAAASTTAAWTARSSGGGAG